MCFVVSYSFVNVLKLFDSSLKIHSFVLVNLVKFIHDWKVHTKCFQNAKVKYKKNTKKWIKNLQSWQLLSNQLY